MKVTVECSKCQAETEISLRRAVGVIQNCADYGFVFGGFLCENCEAEAKLNGEDTFGEDGKLWSR
jgi:hypothetical protein